MERLRDEIPFFKKLSILPKDVYGINLRMERERENKKFSEESTWIRVAIYPFGDEISENIHQQPTLTLRSLNWSMANYLKDKKFKDKLQKLVSNTHSVMLSWSDDEDVINRLEIKKWNKNIATQFDDFFYNHMPIHLEVYFYIKPILGQHIDNIIEETESTCLAHQPNNLLVGI